MAKLTYFSHSAWKIETNGTTILIDPFLDDNPTSPVKSKDVTADYIIITPAKCLSVTGQFSRASQCTR